MSATQLKDKVIALTGAAQGIGFATALLLASRGATLSLADVQAETLLTAKADILAKVPAAKILTVAVDVQSSQQVEAWIQETVSRFGRLDGAVNLAAIVPKSIFSDAGMVENMDGDEWDQCLGVNLKGVMHCMKYQLKAMDAGASLVNMSSIAGLTGRAKNGIYATAKHGVIGLTRTAAKEVGPRGVRVNAVCPGRIETPMTKAVAAFATAGGSEDSYVSDTLSTIPLRRAGEPEEVAKLIAFLLSEESSYITGNAISIDGGWNC